VSQYFKTPSVYPFDDSILPNPSYENCYLIIRQKDFMKKFFFLLGLGAVITVSVTSCSTMKKDCQGNRHVRLKNGIYI
jgi:hypothetical protein